jgi:hypothetical protein
VPVDRQSIREAARGGLGKGLVLETPSRARWDVSARCENPVPREMYSRPWRDYRGKGGGNHVTWGQLHPYPLVAIDLETKCRRCPTCLRLRAAHWRHRAEDEIERAARTWFGTITLRPEKQFLLEVRATARLRNAGVEWSHLSPPEQFAERHSEAGAEKTAEPPCATY